MKLENEPNDYLLISCYRLEKDIQNYKSLKVFL